MIFFFAGILYDIYVSFHNIHVVVEVVVTSTTLLVYILFFFALYNKVLVSQRQLVGRCQSVNSHFRAHGDIPAGQDKLRFQRKMEEPTC